MEWLPSTACKTALAYEPGEPERATPWGAASANFEWNMSLNVRTLGLLRDTAVQVAKLATSNAFCKAR